MSRTGAHTSDEPRPAGGKIVGGGSRKRAAHNRRRARLYRPGNGGPAFEMLEDRRLLSTSDLTQQIDSLLTGGMTSGTVDLGNVSVGSFLTIDGVTATFQNISEQGNNWSGTVTLSASTASLNVGSGLTGQIQGNAQDSVGIAGTYTLNDQPLGDGAYALDVTSLSVSVPNVLTGSASGVQLTYDPGAPAGQEIAQVGSLSATLTGLDNATATLDNLDLFDNGFKLADGSATANTLDVGSMLAITDPTITFTNAGYTVGSSLTGTIGIASNSVTLFPGEANTATVNGFSGSYDLATSSLSLTAQSTSIDLGTHATITADNLGFALQIGGQSVAVTVGSATADLPDLNITGSITGLTIDNSGFSLASATFTDTETVTLGSVLSLTDPTVTLTNLAYSTAGGLTGDIDVQVQSASLFPGKANTATISGFDANIDLAKPAFDVTAQSVKVDFGSHVNIAADNLGFSLAPDPGGGENVTVTVGSATADLPDLNISGSITGLTIDNSGFSLTAGSFTDNTTVALGSVLSFTDPTVTFSDLAYSTTGGLSGTIGVKVQSASVLPGATAFTATVDGFAASINLTQPSFQVGATDIDIKVSDIAEIDAQKASFGLSPAPDGSESVTITVASATASLPRFNLSGSATNVTIDNTGFSVGSASLTDTGIVSYEGVFSLSQPYAQFTSFGYTTGQGASFDGSITVGAAAVSLTAGSAAGLSATGVSGSISFAPANFGAFTFTAATVTANLGKYLTLNGSNVNFNDPASGGDIASFGTIAATLALPGGASITGSVNNLGIGPDGSFTPATPQTPVSGSLSVNDPGSLDWPSWLPIDITKVSISWPHFTENPTDFSLEFSASINPNANKIPGTPITLSGSVTDVVIDTGLLEAGQFPITGLGGASITVGGNLFGLDVSGTLFVAILNVDANGNVVPDGNPQHVTVANHYLYGGIEGTVDLADVGGLTIELGVSQFGLLDAFVSLDAPIVLDPDSGLAITNLHAGIEFGQTLPSITDPHLLNPQNAVVSSSGQDLSALTPPAQQTTAQWEAGLEQAMANVAKGVAQGLSASTTLTSSFVLDAGATLFDAYATEDAFRLDGDVLIDSTGKLEVVGALTIGDSVSLKGAGYIDLSQVSSGKAEFLLYGQGPSQAPIVTVYGALGFQYNGPTTKNTQATTPDLGTGLALNGTTDYVTASNINLNNTSYTVEFWARRADTGRTEYVIGQGDTNTADDLKIGFDASNDFFVSQAGTTLDYPTTDDNWHHWSITYDQTTGTLSINLDGQPVASQTGVQPLQNTSTTLLIGKSGSTYFDGSVDEVRVWSIARTAADIQSDDQSSTPATTVGLLADWTFNEGQGTIASDSSGNGNTATLEGSPTWAITVVDPPAANSFASFTINVSGEVDLTIPDVPTGVQVTGAASFTVTPGQQSLDLTVNGHASLPQLGADVGLAGNVHFDVSPSGTPELYGILQVQVSDLQQLQQLGITVSGTAVLEFNTTAANVTGSLQLPMDSTSTTFNYTLPAQSASLLIEGAAAFQQGGQDWFSLNGELYAYFGIQPVTNDPLLQFFIACTLFVGPSSNPYLAFNADGFLQVSDAGVAAELDATLLSSSALAAAGVDIENPSGQPGNTFHLLLNTTGQAVSFTVPQVSVPAQSGTGQTGGNTVSGTVPGAGSTVNIPAAPTGQTTPEPYLQLDGTADLTIDSAFNLNGSLSLLVAPGVFSLGIDMTFNLEAGGTVLDAFTAQGGLVYYAGQGYAAALVLQQQLAFPSGYGFSLNAAFAFDANDTGQPQSVGGIAVPAADSRGSTNYAEVEARGSLSIGGFTLTGLVDFLADNQNLQLVVAASASLGPVGSANVFGNLTLQAGQDAGIYGVLEATLTGSSSLPITIDAALEAEINTTGVTQSVSTVVDGQVAGFTVTTQGGNVTTTPAATLTLASNDIFTLVAGGSLTIDNIFDLAGEFDFTATTTGLNIDANAELTNFFGTSLGLTAQISVIDPSSAGPGGLVVNAALSLNAGNLDVGLVSISATPTLMINTTNSTVDGVAPNTYEVALQNASLNVLGFG